MRLRLLGFDVRDLPPEADLVRLDELPGVSYNYVEARQAVEIDASDEAIVPVVLDASVIPTPIDPDRVVRNTGAVLNYGIYADVSPKAVTATGQYNLRILTRRGVGQISGYANWIGSGVDDFTHVRLDTNWRYVDVRNVAVLTIGDAIADPDGLGSAYRLGGIQLRRDYGGRTDLVTNALPILNGSAAVPSTIDLYINGLRYFTGEVGRGPFQFRSLPNVGGGASATIVLTDATGRKTEINRPIFFVRGLLPKGMLDFSIEAGLPRLNYGLESFDYFDQVAASGSIRYGLTDRLTLRAHAEGMHGLVNGSVGGTVRLGGFGELTAGLAASHFEGATGIRYLVQGHAILGGVDLYAALERADSDFQNIVTATATKSASETPHPTPRPGPIIGPVDKPVQVAFSRRTERFGASFTVARTGVNLGYTRVHLPDQQVRLANVSLHRSLGGGVSAWANAYRDFGDRDDYGLLAGISITLGERTWGTSSISHTPDATVLAARVSHNTGNEEGALGWSLVNNQALSGDRGSLRAANVRYVAHHAILGGGIEEFDGRVRGHASVEGAVVAMGGLFLAPRIGSSFAVVSGAGADTPVKVNTREITHTDSHGRALVPELRSLTENTVAIDPSNLPIDMKPARTEVEVIPGDRAGVHIDFGVAPEAAAVLVLVDETGQPLPVGSLAILEGSTQEALVGYDGRAYLTGLAAQNRVRVQRRDAADCSVSFDFTPVPGEQVTIGPLVCR